MAIPLFNDYKKPVRLLLFNLLLVAIAGFLMRYKIAFSLPIVDQKNLMHAHSHFAFAGWVSLALFIGYQQLLIPTYRRIRQIYLWQFLLLLFSAFGMLLSFPFQGYGAVSISFSTINILVGYWWAYTAWKDIRAAILPKAIRLFANLGLLFLTLSSMGVVWLTVQMATLNFDYTWNLSAVYFYLHFQYNGWFSFGVVSIFLAWLNHHQIIFPPKRALFIAIFWGASIIPGYFQSVLWMYPPVWIWIIAFIAAVMQTISVVLFLGEIWKLRAPIFNRLQYATRYFWGFSLLAMIIKCALQLLSCLPAMVDLAFGFRAIVIGYLHLVLLGFISFFLLGYLTQENYLSVKSTSARLGWMLFLWGVILNELFLFLQGALAIQFKSWAFLPYALLAAAGIMVLGLALWLAGQRGSRFLEK